MNKLESIETLNDAAFRRLTDVKKNTFEVMREFLEIEEKKRKALGDKPNKLCVPNRLLMAIVGGWKTL